MNHSSTRSVTDSRIWYTELDALPTNPPLNHLLLTPRQPAQPNPLSLVKPSAPA